MAAQIDPSVAKMIAEILAWIAKAKPFGIVHKTAPVNYGGKVGLLVWDYIVWNELTFVDGETKSKQSLFNSISDEKTRAEFDSIVSRYGI